MSGSALRAYLRAYQRIRHEQSALRLRAKGCKWRKENKAPPNVLRQLNTYVRRPAAGLTDPSFAQVQRDATASILNRSEGRRCCV
jgi:hypothetical protein